MEKVTCKQDLDRPILNSSRWNRKVSSGLRRIAVVIPQHTTEPVAASDLANLLTSLIARFNELVTQTLVVSFCMGKRLVERVICAGITSHRDKLSVPRAVHPRFP